MEKDKWFVQGIMGLVVCGVLFTGSGCAFVDKNITLDKVHSDYAAKVSTDNLLVKVGMPKDERAKEANFVGYVRNGFQLHTADVNLDKPVSHWVQEVIVSNLERAGLNVQALNNNHNSDEGLFVDTKISKLSCDIGGKYKADISLTIKLKNRGNVVLSESYFGQAEKINWWGGASGYKEMTEKAMKACIDKLMPDIIETIKKSEGNFRKLDELTTSSQIKTSKTIVVKKKQTTESQKTKEVKAQGESELPDFLAD
ncbi:MAG: hypothetical protein WCS27_04455 [Victivallaceae bacterium]